MTEFSTGPVYLEIKHTGKTEQIHKYMKGNGRPISYCQRRELQIWKGGRINLVELDCYCKQYELMVFNKWTGTQIDIVISIDTNECI